MLDLIGHLAPIGAEIEKYAAEIAFGLIKPCISWPGGLKFSAFAGGGPTLLDKGCKANLNFLSTARQQLQN